MTEKDNIYELAQKKKWDYTCRMAQIIKERRESLGLTVKDLSEKTGVKATDINRFERQQYCLGNNTIFKLLVALGLDIQVQPVEL